MSSTLFTDSVAELVAIGAAIAANCEPCLKCHYDKARELGISHEDIQKAVNLAKKVKDSPAHAVLELAQRLLGKKTETKEPVVAVKTCCSSPDDGETSTPGNEPATAVIEKNSGCC